jgi:homospermidine synthase
MLVKQLRIRPSQIILYDFVDNRNRVKELIDQGLTYNLMKITEDNIRDLPLAKGDILLDLSYNIDTITLLEFCHAKGVHFVNTSVEEWDPYGDPERPPQELTLYARQLNLRRFVERNGRGPTMIVDHGANPGLVYVSDYLSRPILDLPCLAPGHFQGPLATRNLPVPFQIPLCEIRTNRTRYKNSFGEVPT